MKIKNILKNKGSEVITIREDATVFDAISTLVQNNIGAVIVTDEGGKVVGIVSERDILRASFKDLEGYGNRPVKEIMTRDLLVGEPEDDLEYVETIMTQNRIRHFPIFSDKKMVGIISVGDVIKHQLSDVSYENRHLKDYIQGKYPG